MTNQIVLTVPDDISNRARQIAAETAKSVEEVLLNHLKTLATRLIELPPDEQAELDALRHLSDDTLWTIAREQMPADADSRAHELMNKSALSDDEQNELDQLVVRADRLMLRKAEAATLLRERGFSFSQKDFKPPHE